MTETHKRTHRHPKYKTAYHLSNWADYDQALRDHGDITRWISHDAKEPGTPAQADAENAFSRFKRTFGDRLRAKRDESQEREASPCRVYRHSVVDHSPVIGSSPVMS